MCGPQHINIIFEKCSMLKVMLHAQSHVVLSQHAFMKRPFGTKKEKYDQASRL
jgi:hypothetical protein